jgi:hypothetical protein
MYLISLKRTVDIKGQIGPDVLIMCDFSAPFISIDKLSRPKKSKKLQSYTDLCIK